MKILFLGLLFHKEDEKKLLSRSKCGLQSSGNNFQWNLIAGFDEILEEPIHIISSLPVGTFPNYYKKLVLPSKHWSHIAGAKDKEIGCINLPMFKQIIRYFKFSRAVKQWCSENSEEDLFIIAYSMYLPYLKVLVRIKNKYKNIHTCIIVTDLPKEYGIHSKNYGARKLIRDFFGDLQFKLVKLQDSYVLLTKNMTKPLKITDKPFVIVEGICNPQPCCENTNLSGPYITILYSGALKQSYGLDKLVKAFQQIKQENYRLWLCGIGDYQMDIEQAASEDKRITYYGYVTSDTVQKLQQQATLLINPRPNDGAYTKYSFPSKTIEYMVASKPVLMFKLDGIPKEYDDYLYYIKENSVDSLKEALLNICSKSKEELEAEGRNAYEFVTMHKDGKAQANKIMDMILDSKETKLQIKVLQINITCQYGSTGRIVEELHNFLLENNFSSFIAYSAFSSNLKDSFKIESKFENYIRRAFNRYFGRRYLHSTLGTLRLIKNIKKLHPDLIHLHNIQQNSVHYPMLLKFLKKYGVPVVYTLHDCWAFTGGCYHFTEIGCEGYKYGCLNCKINKKQRDLSTNNTGRIYEIKKKALHDIDNLQIVCVSEWLKTCTEQSFMKDLPQTVIYNGIDTDIFKPEDSNIREKLGITYEEFVILGVVNHWNNKKGLELFAQLAEILQPPYKIVMVGISDKDCPPNVIAVNRTDNLQELVRIYSCCDVFLNASKEESFGLAAAEAMACGTPVIAYSSTACKEVVNSDTGIVLSSFDINELLSAIEQIKMEGKEHYREHCMNRIKNKFSKNKMLENYLAIYTKMLNGN